MREGQESAGGLVTRDEERDALRDDVLVRQLLAALLVDAGEHPAQHVGVLRGVAALPAVVDERLHQADHEFLVLAKLPPGLDAQLALEGQLPHLLLLLDQGAHHGRDEGVRRVPVERVEPEVEPAQRDGVQRERRHVLRDVDLVAGIQPGPLVRQLSRDVQHPRHVLAHRLLAERRHEDVVRAPPERVAGVAGEQAALRGSARLPQPRTDLLVEALIVTDLLDQVGAGHDEPGATPRHREPEDRPVLASHHHEALDGIVRVDVQQVAQHRDAVGTREFVDRHRHWRTSAPSSRGPRPPTRRGTP